MANILTTLIADRVAANPEGVALYAPGADESSWLPITWEQAGMKVDACASAMLDCGVEPQQQIAVFSNNRPEILISDFAAYALRLATTSIYSTSSLEQVIYILNDSETRLLFVGDDEQLAVALKALPQCPKLQKIIVYAPANAITNPNAESFDSFCSRGEKLLTQNIQEIKERSESATPDDIAVIIYTSGTTGEPKGAVLPHSCFNAQLKVHYDYLTSLSDNDTSLSFLPLSHIFEKAWSYFCLMRGIKIYVNLDPHAIQQSLLQVRPTCMCSVPRFWEKVYTTIHSKLDTMKGVRKWVLNTAMKIGHRRNLDYIRLGKKPPFFLELRYKFFNRQVIKPLKHLIGVDNGNIYPTAGAPIAPAIVEFFRALDIPMVVGYGLSETTATVTCFPYIGYEIGTAGTAIPGIEMKIGDNNEILVKSPTVMREYLGKPQATAEVFTPDGFFRTGDAGFINEDGALVITDRIKDLFKTSNGKYIAPQAIESALGADPLIEQLAVIGDQRKFVSALIVPAFPALKQYAKSSNIEFNDNIDLVENPEIRSLYAKRIEEAQKQLAPFERIKRFTLLPKEFTMENGELTNTLKIKRPVINKNYASEIEAMYQ